MQWIQYSIITDIVMKYYKVDAFLVDMTSMIYMITYIPFIFPASYILDKYVSIFKCIIHFYRFGLLFRPKKIFIIIKKSQKFI